MPHYLSMATEEAVEEEQRLAYVAVTRAKKHLFVSHTRARGYSDNYQ